jgi:dsDNA-specific endonuclease/ATPase MutS2
MDEAKIKGALEGEIKLEELSDDELAEFRKKARELAEKEKGELTGFREAKRAEAERVEKLKKEAEGISGQANKTKEDLEKDKAEVTQFRREQILKAKEKFLTTFPDAKEKIDLIDEKFGRLDSGKIDSDFIYSDFVSAYAASDPDGYLAARQKAEDLKKNAEKLNAGSAGYSSSKPADGSEAKKFDEKTTQVAKEAGISEEAADKVLKQGLTRRYE